MRVTEFQPRKTAKPTPQPVEWEPILTRLERILYAIQIQMDEAQEIINQLGAELEDLDTEIEAQIEAQTEA